MQSVEILALLRVLSITHIAICMPHRWLAGNCPKFEKHQFGVADMCEAVDLMEDAFKAIADDGNQLLDEAFMMGIYEPLMERLPPLKKYMAHMF